MYSELPNLPLVQERFWNIIKDKYNGMKVYPEYNFYVFPQTWGSTALGFGGVGGSAITKAYTTVIYEEYLNIAGVFFGERLAYVVKKPNKVFFDDLKKMDMKPVKDNKIYTDEVKWTKEDDESSEGL